MTHLSAVTKQLLLDVEESFSQGERYVLLIGLSGLGKDFIAEEAGRRSGVPVINCWDLILGKSIPEFGIATLTPKELMLLKEQRPHFQGRELLVRGMTREDILSFAQDYSSSHSLSKQQMSIEAIADISAGIPLIATTILHLGLDRENAIRFFARHITTSGASFLAVGDLAKQDGAHLQMKIPDEVLEGIGRFEEGDLRLANQLPTILKEKAVLRKVFGSNFPGLAESPTFKVGNLGIYDWMKGGQAIGATECVLGIVVKPTNLTDYILQAVVHDNYVRGPRMRIFHASERKVYLALVQDDRQVKFFPDGYGDRCLDYFIEYIANWESLPTGSMVILSHDHPGMYHNPVLVGLAIETLLQQLGIDYEVYTTLRGKGRERYRYDSANNRIVEG